MIDEIELDSREEWWVTERYEMDYNDEVDAQVIIDRHKIDFITHGTFWYNTESGIYLTIIEELK